VAFFRLVTKDKPQEMLEQVFHKADALCQPNKTIEAYYERIISSQTRFLFLKNILSKL